MLGEMAIKAVPYIFYGILLHSYIDWFLQSHAVAINKSNWRKPHGYFHAVTHIVIQLVIFPIEWAIVIGVLHFIIDTRIPLQYWRRLFSQTTEGEMAIHVQIWQDQTAHWFVIMAVAIFYVRSLG